MEEKELSRVASVGPRRGSALSREGMLGMSKLGPGPTFDFGFAFKDTTFADCILRLYIEPAPEEETMAEGNSEPSSPSNANPGEVQASSSEAADPLNSGDPAPSSPLSSLSLSCFLAISTSASPCEDTLCSDSAQDRAGTATEAAPTIREIPVTAVVLAAKSSFFLKLFTVGMSESLNKGSVTVHLTAKEEPVMLELLSFIYKGTTSPEFSDSFDLTLQLLLLADRFGVEECFVACVDRLNEDLPRITMREALLFLDIPQSVQEYPALRPLGVVSRACIVEHFGPLLATPASEEFLSLSLAGLRALLKADDLAVETEERVFTAVLAWAKQHYKDMALRREVVASLAEDVRFPWMAASFIKGTVMGAPEMRTESSRNLVVDALLLMAAKEDDAGYAAARQLVLRDSRSWSRPRHSFMPPIKSVFFDIPANYCKAWAPNVSFQATSGPFCAAGKWFTLNAKLENQKEGGPRFGLFLRLDKQTTFVGGEAAKDVNCQYRFCVKTLASGGGYQVVKPKSGCIFSEPYHGWGSRDLFRKPWQEIISNPEMYFPDGAMQFRADIWMDRE